MATKEQERKALEQIAEIIRKAGGADSYIGKAFEGCIEMAQENIDNDFWNSWKEKYGCVMTKATEKLTALEDENKALKKRAEDAERLYNMTQQTADSWCSKYHEANNMAKENWNKFREMEDKTAALELENMKLKAKLYDMITEGRQ